MPNRDDVTRLQDALAAVSEEAKQKLRWLYESIDQRYPDTLRDTMLEVLPALVREHGEQAAAVAADWYEAIRLREAGGGRRVRAAGGYPEDAVTRRVRSAMGHAFRGDSAQALNVLSTSLDKFVKQAGRDTIISAADRDRARWARVPRGATTCGFCLMLASRGFAYSSEHAATFRQDGNTFHGECDCAVVVGFGAVPPEIDGYDPEALYEEYLKAREVVGDDLNAIADEMGARARVVVPDNVREPGAHERDTALRLARQGRTVTFRPISNVPGATNPDVTMDGEVWELKSPRGSSVSNTISEQFKSAKRQARRLVIDLGRIGIPDDVAIEQASRRFAGQKRYVELILIDKEGQLIHLTR